MDKGLEQKIRQLGTWMNGKSMFTIPLVPSILECFRIVMTEEEMDFLLALGERSLTEEELKQAGLCPPQRFSELYDSVRSKVLIWQHEGRYELTPIFPGWIELYASGPMTDNRRALLEQFQKFEDFLYRLNIPPIRAYMNRLNLRRMDSEPARMSVRPVNGKKRITLNTPLTTQQEVRPADEVDAVLEQHPEQIAVMNCFCRMGKQLKGHSCAYQLPIEGCMVVGATARQVVDFGIGRKLELEEARRFIRDMEQKGCVHTMYHYGINAENEVFAICNCCPDCCFLYGSYREGSLSQLMMKAYCMPRIVDESACVGCDRCGKFCPTRATYYDKNENRLVFDPDKCVGCGQCVQQCAFPVRVLEREPRNVFVKTQSKREAKQCMREPSVRKS